MAAGTTGLVLKQGLLSSSSHRLDGKILSVVYQPESQTCTVFHEESVSVFVAGSKGLNYTFDGDTKSLLHVSQFEVFVAVGRHRIAILTKDFKPFFETNSKNPIINCLYNPCSGDIITSEKGSITCWSFHHGGKTLSISHVIDAGISEDDSVGIIHLEHVPGNAQRCFVSVRSSVKVYHLVTGRLLKEATDLHSRPISSLLFFHPLQYIITGARDGSIKVWSQQWEQICSFIGHEGPVTSLCPYSSGPLVISGSLDSTMKIWSLKGLDLVQTLDHGVPVQGLVSQPGCNTVISYSTKKLFHWNINELYKKLTTIGSDVTELHATSHPLVPLRLVAACSDGAVRIVSPISGTILTTSLLHHSSIILNTVYKAFDETMFILTEDGTIMVYDCTTNPCTCQSVWEPNTSLGSYTCLSLYELTLDAEELEELQSEDRWLSVLIEAHKNSPYEEEKPLYKERRGLYLLLAGTDEGHIAVLDQTNGTILYSVKDHESPVSFIACNPKRQNIITAFKDEHIIIWRVYPYSNQDALVMMMSFDVIGCPTHIAVLLDRLCIGVNDYDRANYALTVYSLLDLTCYSSNPLHSHSEPITGLDVNTRLHLFVSCAKDLSVRVWSQDNNILRIVQLDAVPNSVSFSSQTGNITVGMKGHLYSLHHMLYLTTAYIKQLVSLTAGMEEEREEAQRELSAPLETFSPEDQIRLDPPCDEFKAEAYRGALSQEELDELDRKAALKTEAVMKLLSREEDLRTIRDAKAKLDKESAALTVFEKKQAWKQVYPLLQPIPGTEVKCSEIDDFDPDTYGLIPIPIEPYEPYSIGPRRCFFPPLHKFDPPYPIAPDCHLPNSTLLQKLRKSDEDRKLAESWKPPTLSDKQRQLMMEQQEGEEEEEEEEDSDLMNRLRAAMMADDTSIPSPSPPPTPPLAESPVREVRTKMKVEKLIAPKPKPKTPPPPPPPKTPTPPPKSPTPPPPTPLPEYITQFIGQAWFDGLFPQPSTKTFPKPLSVTRFIYILLSFLNLNIDPGVKAEIVGAIHKLLNQYNIGYLNDVKLSLLKTLQSGISTRKLPERNLMVNSIKLLTHLNVLDNEVTTTIMGLYSDGSPEVQELIINFLKLKGLDDPHNYFAKELDSSMSGASITDLIAKSTDWLDIWRKDYHSDSKQQLQGGGGGGGGGGGSKGATKGKGTHRKSSTLEVPPMYTNPIDVINYFVRLEHEKSLAKLKKDTPPPPPPPVEEEDTFTRNAVVPLPVLEQHGRLTRIGETHCSCCHPERETSLYLASLVAKQSSSWRTLRMAVRPQTINPFLSFEEKEEQMRRTNVGKLSLISNTRLFVIEHSYPRSN